MSHRKWTPSVFLVVGSYDTQGRHGDKTPVTYRPIGIAWTFRLLGTLSSQQIKDFKAAVMVAVAVVEPLPVRVVDRAIADLCEPIQPWQFERASPCCA